MGATVDSIFIFGSTIKWPSETLPKLDDMPAEEKIKAIENWLLGVYVDIPVNIPGNLQVLFEIFVGRIFGALCEAGYGVDKLLNYFGDNDCV